MDPSVLDLTARLSVLHSHQKKLFEAQDLCKETEEVAATDLAAFSFGEQILRKEIGEREFERGNAGSAWGISWLLAGHNSCCSSFPCQPCVLPSPLCSFWWGQEREEGEWILSMDVWPAEKRCVVYPEECGEHGEKAWELLYRTKLCSKREDSVWSEYHLLFGFFRLAKRTNSAILCC